MSNENNAGVDLAQLDKLELRAKEEKGEGYKLMAVKHDVILALIDLARRASATPSSKDAGGEPVAAQFKVPGETWEECSIDEEEVMLRHGYKFRYLYAAPVRTEVD